MLSTRLIAPVARNLMQRRTMTAISGPPQTRVPQAEKIALAAVMAFCWVAVPGWVLTHIKEYRGIA